MLCCASAMEAARTNVRNTETMRITFSLFTNQREAKELLRGYNFRQPKLLISWRSEALGFRTVQAWGRLRIAPRHEPGLWPRGQPTPARKSGWWDLYHCSA